MLSSIPALMVLLLRTKILVYLHNVRCVVFTKQVLSFGLNAGNDYVNSIISKMCDLDILLYSKGIVFL